MDWKSQKGAYILFLEVKTHTEIGVGRLGHIELNPGIYLYVGSAMGGFGKRLPRYLRETRKKHWHIDYLLDAAELVGILLLPSDEPIEDIIADRLAGTDGVQPVADGFGASDSRNRTHLFRVTKPAEKQR